MLRPSSMDYSALSRDDPSNPLIEPDVLMPGQFAGLLNGHSNQSGEVRLAGAILVEAVETFHKEAFATLPDGRAAFREAKKWLEDREDPGLFAFETVCGTLDINPDYLREALTDWLHENQTRRPRISSRHLADPRRRIASAA